MSPDEALEAMDELNVDLVICDFATPCIDGLHLLRLIRDTVSEGDFIPMLALSGDAKPGTRDEVMTLGADAFLTKPVDSVEMILWVEHLLELRAIRRSSSHPELASGRGVDRATAMQRLENVFRAREVFIASVSHELRTPLTAVLGYASELADKAALLSRDEVSAAARVIAEQATDLSAIIDDLLVATRSDINTVEALDQKVDLVEELRAVVQGISGTGRSRIRMPTGGLVVKGDRLRVRQILRNLITNALRHGGNVVTVQLGSASGMGTVSVIDDGPGVPPEALDRLFEPYFHGRDDSGTPAALGLGLSVSRFLARLMGGDLRLVPSQGGTAFELSLSMADSRSDRAAAHKGRGPALAVGPNPAISGPGSIFESSSRPANQHRS
jgi:signal transduction histidine kinase